MVQILRSRAVGDVPRARKFAGLEDALGYRFNDQKLIERALTHASVRAGQKARQDNERLEFLGDRVLGLVVAAHLHAAHPGHKEGDLARRFNRLVCGEQCARVARSIGLGDFLILSDSEAENGGRDKDTILADAMEAVLGAIYIDSGYKTAQTVVLNLWEEQLAGGSETPVDAKSALQEWAQGQGLPLPRYVEVSRNGPDHAPEFVAEVQIDGLAPGSGQGSSKRQAEQVAATAVLEREGVWKKKKRTS
jgi:ribonuclease-3